MLNALRALLQDHELRPLAAAFANAGHAPGARALLALEEGLLSGPQTAELLAGTVAAAVPVPPVPQVPPHLREMWLRLQAACLLSGRELSALPATSFSLTHPDMKRRLAAAQRWSHQLQRPLTVCVPDYGQLLTVQALSSEIEVITSEELWSLLTASRPGRLRALGRMAGGCLMVDHPHRLDPRGFDPFSSLLESLTALGTPTLLSGPYEAPAGLQRQAQALEPPEQLPTSPRIHHHGSVDREDLIHLLSSDEPTLVILPSRFAALDLMQQLPAGVARLLSRTLTAEHLQLHTASKERPPLTLSTWGTANPAQYRRAVHLQAPLPILADHAWAAGKLEFVSVPQYRVPAASVTATTLTQELLSSAQDPLSAQTMHTYFQALLPHTQRDSLGIEKLRENLDYPAVSAAARALFGRAVTALVEQPGAEQEVARARRTGKMPPFGPFTVKLSLASLKLALQDGRAEQIGDAVIWTGPYNDVRGVGVP